MQALSGLEQRVCLEIAARHGALLEDLARHVALPTGMGNTPALDESRGLLCDRAAALGAAAQMVPGDPKPDWLRGGASTAIPPTAVCTRLRPGMKRVLIAGHLDTVHDPAGEFRTLSVRGDGKTATGPGCVDMKGGLVIALHALEALNACGVECSWSLLLNSDEETGSYHSERALRAAAREHDFGLALEPALPDGSLVVERLGSGQFMLECRGRSAHVGRDFASGVSAVTKLAECLVAIGAMSDVGRGRIINVGPIEGGVVTNAVPDHAAAWGNVRFPTWAVSDELAAMLAELETPADAMPAVTIHRSFNRPAKPQTEAVTGLALAARGVAEALGQRLPFGKTGGVCDGNILQDAGLPTIDTVGVRGGGLHTPEEWIDLASLVERCQLLAVLIMRLSAGAT